MMISGTAYGVVLNDRAEREALAAVLTEKPYQGLPQAPVVYIKPGVSLTFGGAAVPVPAGTEGLTIAPTVALFFGRASTDAGLGAVAATALALDVSLPGADYYRPDIARRCRDGFLPLGAFTAPVIPEEIVTFVDDVAVHRWRLDRLVRDPARLIGDLSTFMTLRPGDLLLAGLPGDAPTARAGQRVRIEAAGLPALSTILAAEAV